MESRDDVSAESRLSVRAVARRSANAVAVDPQEKAPRGICREVSWASAASRIRSPVHLVSRRERRRGEFAGDVVGQDCIRAARLRVRRFDDDDNGLQLGEEEVSPVCGVLLPLGFHLGGAAGLGRIRPDMLVLAELELWPNLIRLSRAAGVKVAIVNGRLSERSFRGYRRIRWLIRPLLERIDLIAAQNEEYAQRFLALGARPQSVHVTGSIKFDGRKPIVEIPRRSDSGAGGLCAGRHCVSCREHARAGGIAGARHVSRSVAVATAAATGARSTASGALRSRSGAARCIGNCLAAPKRTQRGRLSVGRPS